MLTTTDPYVAALEREHAEVETAKAAIDAQIAGLREQRRPMVARLAELEGIIAARLRLKSMSPAERAEVARMLSAEQLDVGPVAAAGRALSPG